MLSLRKYMNNVENTQKKRKAILPDGAVKLIAERVRCRPEYVSRALHHPEKTPSVKCQLIRNIADKVIAGLDLKADKVSTEIIEGAA